MQKNNAQKSDSYVLKITNVPALKNVLLPLIPLYIGILTAVLSTFTINNSNISSFFSNLGRDKQEIEIISKEVAALKNEIELLSASSNSSTEVSYDYTIINERLNDLEKRSDAISSTILSDADKAITATVLREKQNNLEKQFTDLREDQKNLSGFVNTLILTVIAVPVITVIFNKFFASNLK